MWFKPGSLAAALAVTAASSRCACVASFAPVGFGVGRTTSQGSSSTCIPSTTALNGRAIKRGKLADNVSPGGVKGTAKKKKKKKGGGVRAASSSSPSSAVPGGISSKLSEWAASATDDSSSAAVATAAEVAEVDSPDRRPKKKAGKGEAGAERRSRQAERREREGARRALVERTIGDLDDIFNPTDEEGNPKTQRKVEYDLDFILGKVRTLIDNPNPNVGPRVLSAGQKLRDYRMVWAGSGDAICHLGTGLHNVALARLDEVFLTMGKGRVEIKEVIRIIGPFPNVRNTLKGDATVMKGSSRGGGGDAAQSRLRIDFDSMVDGTGKEILAGTEENRRLVDLDVLYADEGAIVCVVPSEEGEGGGGDPLGENGSRVLLFFSEDDMDLKLEMMRVA